MNAGSAPFTSACFPHEICPYYPEAAYGQCSPTQNAGTAYSVLSIISVIFVANFESPVHFFWGSIWILEAAMRRASGCRMHDVNCNQATLARRAGGPTSDRGNSTSQRNVDPQRRTASSVRAGNTRRFTIVAIYISSWHHERVASQTWQLTTMRRPVIRWFTQPILKHPRD